MIIRKKSPVVHQIQHYKLYKSGKYLVTSAIMGLSVLGAFTFNNSTKVHADTTANDRAEDVKVEGNVVTTTSASSMSETNNANSGVTQETAPVNTTQIANSNSTVNNLEHVQPSSIAEANQLNVSTLNTSLQQNTDSGQNDKSLMTNMAVSNEAAQADVINKVKATGITPNTNQIVALTDYGAKGDGQTDDTQSLQKALDSINQAGGGILDIPAGNYMIKATNATNEAEATIPWQTNQGVKVPSNTTLFFEKGAKLSVVPNASWNYCLLNLTNSKNVNILNGELVGDRDKHDTKYTKTFRTTTKYQGETGWGILMTGAENVNIIGNNIHDFWGDGIDLYGDNANPGINSNIVVKYNTLNHNRRQGISVENVNGLIFDHNLVENTDGTAPRAGMDIEPANFKDPSMRIAHDITITNNIFRNNNGSGLMTYGLSTHAEGFSDGPSRISNLTIKNNTFDGNNTNSFAVEGTAGEGAWNWQQNMNGQLTVLGTSNTTVENNKFINPNPKGININEANGDVNAVINANTYKTAGMFVGFNENAQIHNNYLQGQDIFVTGNQSPSYAFNNISGSVTNNYANAVIANGTLNDATKKSVVPDGQNYKDTAAAASFIASTGAPESNSDQTANVKQAVNADAIINEAKSYGITPATKNVVTVADYGIDGATTTDVTAKIQAILDLVKNNGGGIVYVPAGTYMIRADDPNDLLFSWQKLSTGLKIDSNTTLLLDKGATLKAIANDASGYSILNIGNAENVNVLGGTIEGDRDSHILDHPFNQRNGENFYGEWGDGAVIYSAKNITIIGTTFKNNWGDGIDVYPPVTNKNDGTKSQVQNLIIRNCNFDHNRRQGVSLEHVNGAIIEHNIFQNTNGTGPASGLDLEPGGDSTESVENVIIRNNIFQNNTNQGLTMYAAPGTHVRNIKVLNNTFANNGSWITGQVNLQQAENVEVAYNHVISDDGSRFYGIDSIGSSSVNIHDNYLPNGSIVITKDNPAAGFSTPSGSVKNNYVSSVTIEHDGFDQVNNVSPSQADASIRSKIGADWNATDKTTHPNTITNEKLTLTGFNSRGKAYNVTANPSDTVLGNYDPMSWKGSFSFDIDGTLLQHKSTSDDVIRFEKPMFTLYHNQDDQVNLGTDELYLGNQGKPIYINGQNVGTLYSSYIVSNGTFKGSGVQHVTIDNIDMGDGRLHINGADHKTANETVITTADGKKYGFSFKAADGTLNIPEDKSLNDTTKPDIPVIPTEETVSKTITMNFVWGDESNHFTLMNDGSNTVYAGINGQSGTAVTVPVHIKLTEKHESNQWILASAESDNPNVKVSIDQTNLLKPKVDINPQYHGVTLVTDSKAPLSDSVNEFVLDLNPALTKDQMFSTFKSEYTTKVYVPKVKFSINYQNEATGKIIGSQLYQGDLTPDGAILKLNNHVPEGYQLDPNHSGDQVRWNGDKYLLELHKQSGWTTITNDMGKPDANGSATYTSLLTESIIPIHKASLTYQFVDDNNNGANVGNPVVITGNVNSVQQVSELSVPTNYQLAAGQSLPTSVQIPQNNDTLKIHLVHVTQSVSDSKIIYRTINVTDPNGKVTSTKQSAMISRQGTKDLVTNQTNWDNWNTNSLSEYDVPTIPGYQASQNKVAAQLVTANSQDSTINISYVANAQTVNVFYKDGDKVVKTVPLIGKTGETVDVNIDVPEHYHVTNQVVKNYTFKASKNPDIVVELGHDTQIVSDSKTVTRTINVTDPNGQKTNHVQTVTLTRTGAKDLVTGQTSWSAWSTGSFPSYQTPEIDGYTANQSVPAMTVTSDTQDSTVNINYQKNASVLDQIKNYKYLYMGFDPSQATKQDPWKATVALTVSNDGVNWKLIKEYPQLGTFRDADINKIGDTYYIVGTLGAYKTKDLEHFEPVDFSAISSKQDDGTYHDTWAPELFQDLSGRWHVIYCAKTKNNQQNVYLADFDPATGSITNAWTQINGLHAIDPHIWTHNNQYYLTLNGTHLYTANDYQGPWTKLKTNLADTLATTGHWYEAGETLTDGNKLYYYFDNIYANSDLPEDSGHMMVTTADINGPTKWTTPEPVQSSITMRHGSFINQQQAPLSFTIKVVDTDNNNQEVNSTQVSSLPANYDSFVPTNYELAGYKLDNQVLTLSLRHQKQAVTDSKTVKRQIILNRPERQIDATQEVTLTRTGTNDLVTGKTTWADWTTGTFQKFVPPVIQGYTASQSIVPAEHVDGNTKDSTVTVSYSPSQQTINIKYLDGAHVIKTVPVTGNTGENVDINVDVPVHYHVANHVPKTYLLKAEGNEDVVVELAHNMQNVNDSKTIQRVINLTAPDGKQTTTKQSATITRRGSKDLVTNQTTWDNWNLATLPNYEVPSFAGYQPTLTKVEAEPVDGDTKDSTIDISYVADKQSVNIIYKDGQQIIKTVPLTGKTGETVKVPINVPTNYHLKNQPADSYTFKANDNPDVVVELEHDTQSTDDFKVVTRVIKITHPDGQVTTDTQKATITRKGSKDKVTSNIAWNNWSTAKWDQYNATKIPGYTSTMSVVSEQVVTSDTPDTTVEIKYVANPQQANIIYKDGDQVVKTTTLDGKTGETVDVNLDVPEHYYVVNQVAKTYSFKSDHNDDVIVELGHDIQQVSDSHTINRTINLISPDGTKKSIKQSVSINRTGAKDLVTGDITWSDWSDAQLPEYVVPVLDGYTASQNKVTAEKVTSNAQDSTVNITYVANQQSVNIIYKDGNQVVKTAVLTGKTDETVKVPVELPANYHVDGKTPTDYTFKAKDNQDIVINLGHDTQTVTRSKTVKRTIKLELPGETDNSVVQQVTFTRHGIKDLVTGKTTWGSWDHNGKYQFDSYAPQTIAGYEATSDKVDSLLVTPESKDSEVTISYHKLATKLTVNPQTSQEPAAYTPKVQISQVSQPVVATQPKIEPQQELPHTGNDNETALATGFMGLLLAIGSLSFGKKYRI